MRLMLIVGMLLVGPTLAGRALADTTTGVDQWRTAATRGDPEALFQLGQAYRLGRGVPVDTAKAQDYYRQAAAKGHAIAADNYGLSLFQNGRPREAIPYLEKAAQRGDPRAQYILGTMVFNGVDIKQDWVRAYALLTRSQRSGLAQASKALTQMDRYIPAEQRRLGVAMADRLVGPSRAPTAQVASRDRAVAPAARATVQPGQSRPPAAVAPVATASTAGGGWRVQLGAFGNGDNARRLGQQQASHFPGQAVEYVPAGALIKVVVGHYPSRAAAIAACRALTPCVPVGP